MTRKDEELCNVCGRSWLYETDRIGKRRLTFNYFSLAE